MTDRDMVSKAEVLDIYAELYDEFDGAPGIIKVLNKVYDKLERLQPHKPVVSPTVGGWISVKDRLPEKSGNVLVCVKLDYAAGARYVQMCHYSAYKKQFGCFDTLENSGFPKFGVVTHWMPLPEPPMEGDA